MIEWGKMSGKIVFCCGCNACQRDGTDGMCFFSRSAVRINSNDVKWIRTSSISKRGYSEAGRLVAMRYPWSDYVAVPPHEAAVPVPSLVFALVKLCDWFEGGKYHKI